MRPLSDYDWQLLRLLFFFNQQLPCRAWISTLIGVEDIGEKDADWYHIRLHYSDTQWQGGGYSILADWCATDIDGGFLGLLALGTEEGRPYEIEIHRGDCKPITALPPVEAWVK